MAVVNTSNKTERNFLVEVGSAYSLMFDEVELTVPAGGWVAGTVLTSASAAVDSGDTSFFGIVAESVDAGTVTARVLVRGVCTVRQKGLVYADTSDSAAEAAVAAEMAELLITIV